MSDAPFYAVSTAANPFDLVAGKSWGWEFEFGETEAGPAIDLAETFQSAELRVTRPDGQSDVWTLDDAQLAFLDGAVVIRLTEAETAPCGSSNCPFLLSLGYGADADMPVLRGILAARVEA